MEEIKEIIEFCLLGDCTGCPLHDYIHCRDVLFRNTLNVLNALEKENKDLKKQTDQSGGGKTATEREGKQW